MNEEPRQIVASVIRPEGANNITPGLLPMLMAVTGRVCNYETASIPDSAIAFVEAATKASFQQGILTAFALSRESMQEVLGGFVGAMKDAAPDTDEDGEAPVFTIAVGSPAFCKEVIRFLNADCQGMTGEFYDQYAAKIDETPAGTLLWSDTTGPDVIQSSEMSYVLSMLRTSA